VSATASSNPGNGTPDSLASGTAKPKTYKTCADCAQLLSELPPHDEIELGGLAQHLVDEENSAPIRRLKAICDRRGGWGMAASLARCMQNSEK